MFLPCRSGGWILATTGKGCLESVEWNGGMEHWNGILEWNTGMKVIISINIID